MTPPPGGPISPARRPRRPGSILRLATGWTLTAAGLILGPVPIFPGFLLLLPGVAMLCAESRWLRGRLRRYREHRLMKRALREAERVGVRINLDADSEEEADEAAPPGRATGSGG